MAGAVEGAVLAVSAASGGAAVGAGASGRHAGTEAEDRAITAAACGW